MALRPGKHYVDSNIRLTAQIAVNCDETDAETLQISFISPSGVQWAPLVYGTDAALQRVADGNYVVDFVPNEPGRWFYRWEVGSDTEPSFNIKEEGNFLVQDSPFYQANAAYGRRSNGSFVDVSTP